MSSNAAATSHLGAQHTAFGAAADCDDFFAWAEVEHRKDTMSIEEAASLLAVSVEYTQKMIDEGSLCAIIDLTSGQWLVKTLCVRAQLAETVPLATAIDTTIPSYQTAEQFDEAAKLVKELSAHGSSVHDVPASRRLIAQHKKEHREASKNALFVAPDTVTTATEAVNKVFTAVDELFDASPDAVVTSSSPFRDSGPGLSLRTVSSRETARQAAPSIETVSVATREPVSSEETAASTERTSSLETGTSPKKKPLDRAEITAKNIQALMDSLDFANVRLEGSMYRIGYLEAQVNSLETQMTEMNTYRNRAAKAILTDRENTLLKQTNASLYLHNEALQEQIFNLQHNLETANILLTKIEQTWWYKLCAWLFRFKIHEEPARQPKES